MMTVHQAGDLPDVIMLKIFSFLHFGDLCRMGRVCRRWYELSHSQVLWKKIEAQDIQLTSQQMEKLASILPSCATHLHVCGVSLQKMPFFTPKVINGIREQCPNLYTIIIENAYIAKHINWTDITVEDLPPSLKTLSLRKSFFHPDQFFCSASHPTVPEIQCLDVSNCWCISDQDIPFFTRLSSLRELYLENCDHITNCGINLLVSRISTIEVLDLEGTHITDDSLSIISNKCSILKKLFLGRTWITDNALKPLSKNCFPVLEELCLIETKITSFGLALISKYFVSLKQVKVNYGFIKVDDNEKLSTLLPSTRTLHIEFNESTADEIHCKHFYTRNS